ncbi:hypothetical protein [Kocuria rosea]|uniref:hypothetical protein n=1 Tax=Kocuria rosea TaxID=1275 RepID=UPI0011B1CBB1|nr:hypothetical protein [Kocuria rosea]
MDVPAALNSLATLPLGAIVIMVFSLVLVTMITQAFSFQAIRLLEGYWSPKPPFSFALAACVRWQLHRRNKLEERCKKLNEKAFESAKMRLVQSQKQDFINTWEADLYGLSMDQRACTDLSIIKIARSIPWREEADPGLVAVWERCENRLESFPGSNRRLLPTRLGNTLRASEDKLGRQGRALEGFVMQNYQNIPARLMVQHDQFRDRLDMYSSLVLVFTILALGAPFLLSGNLAEGSWVNSVGGSLVFLALAYSSYRAAISSADGYGSILLAISTYLPSPEDD